MNDLIKPTTDEGAANLLALIKQLIKEKQYEGVALLFTSNKEAERNLKYLSKIAMEVYRDICLENLTDKVNQTDSLLYMCAQELMKTIASYAPAEELLLELLELVEENQSTYVFISALKSLQVVLLRLGNEKPRALEWSLKSICTHLADLQMPEFLKEAYDPKLHRLLELDLQIQNILMDYIALGFFYDPLIDNICSQARGDGEIFRPVGITRRNVLCCFLVQLLGKPLALLDLINDKKSKTNTYTMQVAESLTQGVRKCIPDPLFLLSFVESRARFRRRKDERKGVHEMSSCNIFLIDEKLPLHCLAIYYYMIFVANVDIEHIPIVYHPLYIFESCLYLIYELMLQEEPALHDKSLLLMQKLLQNLQHSVISVTSLELEIHKSVFLTLCKLVGYSSHTHVRKNGLKVLRQYITSFDDEGKYLILKNLLKSSNHDGIAGYLVTIYKDLVAEALKSSAELPSTFCGHEFHNIFVDDICQLPYGVETDLLENFNKIMSALNALRFFATKDVENRTGFWNYAAHLEVSYLATLRTALDLSIAHFKAEIKSVELGIERPELKQLSLLDINVTNDKQSKLNLELDRNEKLNVLNQNLCTFDLMCSLLGFASECLANTTESIKRKNQT